MRTPPSLAVSLLLILSLLLSQAQGIRLEKGFGSVKPQNTNIQEDSSTGVTEKSERTAASGVLSKDCGQDDHCSSGTTSLKKINVSRSSSPSAVSSSEKSSSSSHSHHWLPSIHEDYYGPRRHRSKHH